MRIPMVVRNSAPLGVLLREKMAPPSKVAPFFKMAPLRSCFSSSFFLSVTKLANFDPIQLSGSIEILLPWQLGVEFLGPPPEIDGAL